MLLRRGVNIFVIMRMLPGFSWCMASAAAGWPVPVLPLILERAVAMKHHVRRHKWLVMLSVASLFLASQYAGAVRMPRER